LKILMMIAVGYIHIKYLKDFRARAWFPEDLFVYLRGK
jgi:hypothetical protein